MNKFSKKSVAMATGALLFLSAGAAYAWWSNTGSGSGTAASTSNAGITINQNAGPTDMYPGGPVQNLSGSFNNTNNPSPVYVASVSASPTVAIDWAHEQQGCTTASYRIGGGPSDNGTYLAVNQEVPVGSYQGTWSGLTIQMVNLGYSQDPCKGATVTITYTSG